MYAVLTKTQERQLEFLDSLEPYESFTKSWEFHCNCYTCKESKVFRSVEGARCFIYNHRGHKTWVQFVR